MVTSRSHHGPVCPITCSEVCVSANKINKVVCCGYFTKPADVCGLSQILYSSGSQLV